MTTVDTVPIEMEDAEIAELYSERGGVLWYGDSNMNVRDVARAMNAVGARFFTITTYELPANAGFRLEYHWDLMGRLLGFTFPLSGNTIDSIYDLCEAVDWIEREVHEEYRIDFTGRTYEPLLLREGGACGVNLQKEVVQ
jgi:NADH:ubiquinone oxidoreductase subunit C